MNMKINFGPGAGGNRSYNAPNIGAHRGACVTKSAG